MDDIDDLFTDTINDDLNIDLNGALAGDLNDELNVQLDDHLANTLNGQLDIPTILAPPAGLIERLDELHTGGCNQSIAWSRLGALAFIGADRKTVSVQCLQFHHDGQWRLSEYVEPTLMDKLSGFYRGFDFVHVAWGPSGNELLVIDSCGRIAVGYVFVALNRIIIQKLLNYDPDDNFNAVVALKWLKQVKKPILLTEAAVKEKSRWKYLLSPSESRGPFSPTQKPGFLIVTRGCMLKLYLQGLTPGDWMEVRYELDGISSSYEIISHATMCTERNILKKDDDILLAIHTISKKLRLYSVRIDWQVNQDPLTVTASIHVQHITQVDYCLPLLNQSFLHESIGLVHEEEAKLCSLMLIPRQISQTVQAGNDSPIILALYSHNSLTGHFNTIILRWKLDESNAIVEPTFSQLSTKKSSNDRLPDERILRPLEEICLDRLVVDIHLLSHDTVIALCYNTGEVEFRDHDLNALTFDDDLNRVISLNRIGFSFSDSEPCLQTSLSPHAMVKVSINKAYERKLSSMQFLMPTEDPDVISQVIAAFVLEHAASEGAGGVQVDDLIMIMSEFVQQLSGDQRKMFKEQFMKDLYQTFQVTERCIDTNVDGLIKFAGLGKAVGMQSALGLRSTGNGKLRYTRPGRIALTIQSLRIIALSLSYSVANLQKGQEIDFHRPETLDYITPQVKWFITLVDYILDQLFQVNRVMGVDSFDGDAVASKVEASYVCLVLVMCTITRNYIRYIIRAIRTLPQILQSMSQTHTPTASKYAALSAALRSCVISPFQFDQILEATDQILYSYYLKMKPGHRQEIEMQLLAEASIPSILNPVIHILLSQSVEQARLRAGDAEEILAFRQWGPVSLVDDGQTSKWESETIWDGSRKTEITGKNVRTRTCLRCIGIMEDPTLAKERTHRPWLVNLTRTCFCGGHWVVG